ncbi:hypothetical protein GCM10018966_061570 [Streptomyces yanii]
MHRTGRRELPGKPFRSQHNTAHKHLIRWAVDGTWERIFGAVLSAADASERDPRRHPHQPSDQVRHRLRRGRAGGLPPTFDAEAYKHRSAVERCIKRIKQ